VAVLVVVGITTLLLLRAQEHLGRVMLGVLVQMPPLLMAVVVVVVQELLD
jgi:hypothetical protein